MRPDRVVVGAENDVAATIMKNLYAPFIGNGHPFYVWT